MSTAPVSFSELEATVTPAAPVTPQVTPAATEPVAPATPQFTEADAQTLRTFADAGITLTSYQDLLQAKEIVNKLPELLKTNPRLVTAEIAKADPTAYRNLLTAVSDEWYEVIGQYESKNTPTNGVASSTATSAPNPQLEQRLNEQSAQIASLIAERNQEKSERQQASMVSSYNKAIGDLMGKLPEGVPATAKEFIELKTQRLIWQDVAARDRVSKGIYVDVPKYFAQASAQATADIKAATDSEHNARKGVEARGGKEITPAAEAVNGTQAGPNEDPIWGDSGIARDVSAALKR